MNNRSKISRKLKDCGYLLVKETGNYDRFKGALGEGSLYVKDNYISATGAYKVLEESVSRSSSDSKGCPESRGASVNKVLSVLEGLTN